MRRHVEDYRKLKDAGIGTYIMFQETYHKQTYERLHPTGPKNDYAYHTEAMDRAMEGGIDDVGLGVLFGLELYRYELAALLMHAEHLEAVWGVGPHTILFRGICPADDVRHPAISAMPISDDVFCKIVTVLRIAVPYTGMIVSTVIEKDAERVLELGVSQISAFPNHGGRFCGPSRRMRTGTVRISDTAPRRNRQLLFNLGYIRAFVPPVIVRPDGRPFMNLVKIRTDRKLCQPNAP
jgi:2-iminoacetate synthase